jgi:hypothetical protein
MTHGGAMCSHDVNGDCLGNVSAEIDGPDRPFVVYDRTARAGRLMCELIQVIYAVGSSGADGAEPRAG